MNIILTDLDAHLTFAPLTLTRPIGNLRMGRFTNDERWRRWLPESRVSFHTEDFLKALFPIQKSEDNYWVNACVIPTKKLIDELVKLSSNEALYYKNTLLVYRGEELERSPSKKISFEDELVLIENRWDLFKRNNEVLEQDFKELMDEDLSSASLPDDCTLIGSHDKLFIHPYAEVCCSTFNTTAGPIYIDENAEVMEGCLIRGGLYLGKKSALKMGTKIYGASSFGPHSKIGGEVNNCIFQGYSNKGHDGFLGNSLIGEWCNIGADTNTSNLKNNYGKVKTYCYHEKQMIQTNEQFMGVTMGDHAKTGINTMLNTAAVVGVFATIFGSGLPPKYVPEFSWGGFTDEKYEFDKALLVARNMMERRGVELTNDMTALLKKLYKG